MTRYTVFVPQPGSAIEATIRHGSGIVGSPSPHDPTRLVIDFEGNLYGAANLTEWSERVRSAAGRHMHRYPTVARMTVTADDLIAIGEIDSSNWVVKVDPDKRTQSLFEQWVSPTAPPEFDNDVQPGP